MKKLLFVGLMLAFFAVHAEGIKYVGISGNVNTVIFDMKMRAQGSDSPTQVYVSGGASYSRSIKEGINIRYAVDFLHYDPKNTIGDYQFCDGVDTGNTCLPDVKVNTFYFPIGTEFYLNTNYNPIHTFFVLSLVPTFSFTEKIETYTYNSMREEINYIEEKRNGPKFQDLYLSLGVATEFYLFRNFKLFVEPTGMVSVLFRSENVVNPVTMLNIKLGIRHRAEKKM